MDNNHRKLREWVCLNSEVNCIKLRVMTASNKPTSFLSYRVSLSNIFIVAGDYNIVDNSEPGEVVVFPSQVVVHPNYNSPFLANDVALIQLDSDLTFNAYIGRVCIPSSTAISSTFANVFVRLLGWGRTSTSKSCQSFSLHLTL